MIDNTGSDLISHDDIALEGIVSKIYNGMFVIPMFQRNFVWNNRAIEDLGDSILRRYPISSILLMPVEGNLDVKYRALSNSDSADIFKEKNELTYVLDGQQRITSLNSLFLNENEKYLYYVDLLAVLIDIMPNDNIHEKFNKYCLEKNILKMNKYDSEYGMCISFNKSTKKGIVYQRGPANRYILMSEILNGNYSSMLFEFMSIFVYEEESISKYFDPMNKILSNVRSYRISSTNISGASSLDLIIRIFEKINSSGQKLTLFDLINAKSFVNSNSKGLYETLFSDLNQVKERNKAIVQFFNYDKELFIYKKIDSIPRMLFLSYLIKKNNAPDLSKKIMLQLPGTFWEASWIENKENLFHIFDIFYKNGLLEYSSKSFLEYMAAILLSFPDLIENRFMIDTIKNYALARAISLRTTFSKSEATTVIDFIKYAKELSNANVYNQSGIEPPVSIISLKDLSLIGTFGKNHFPFKAVMHILYSEKHNNYFNRDLSGVKIGSFLDYKEQSFDLHHIIPFSLLSPSFKETDSIGNSIANLVLLNSQVNRNEIKDKMFKDYISMLYRGKSLNEAKDILENNLISYSFIDSELINKIDQFDFLKYRLDKIINIVSDYFDLS